MFICPKTNKKATLSSDLKWRRKWDCLVRSRLTGLRVLVIVITSQNPKTLRPQLPHARTKNKTSFCGSHHTLLCIIKKGQSRTLSFFIKMEEEVGFEPTVPVKVRQFSRLLQSTALAFLRAIV